MSPNKTNMADMLTLREYKRCEDHYKSGHFDYVDGDSLFRLASSVASSATDNMWQVDIIADEQWEK